METLFRRHDQYIAKTPMDIVRETMQDIGWDSRLIAIVGARGVGKSTLMRQYVKLNFEPYDRSVLYCSLDSVYFSTHTVIELAEGFVAGGGRRLMLDEVHKYDGWSREIKEIYELYPELKIVLSGSSLLHILNADADLSRRCVRYSMYGLSFREFLRFYKGLDFGRCSLETILSDNARLCAEVNAGCRPLMLFDEYLEYGYYPFYSENASDYHIKIGQVVNFVIDVELPLLRRVDVANLRKIKALVGIIASGVPYELDASKLAKAVGTGRDTVVEYLRHLSDARIFNLLYSGAKSIGKLTRPDKVYLENSNLLYALSSETVEIGTARETFAVSQLNNGGCQVEYGRHGGDFMVDGKYTFEVGGKDKGYAQIAGIGNSYILSDDIETPLGNRLPLWLLGFLY